MNERREERSRHRNVKERVHATMSYMSQSVCVCVSTVAILSTVLFETMDALELRNLECCIVALIVSMALDSIDEVYICVRRHRSLTVSHSYCTDWPVSGSECSTIHSRQCAPVIYRVAVADLRYDPASLPCLCSCLLVAL